jgi:5-methylcytosine-specific restriction enzyme A
MIEMYIDKLSKIGNIDKANFRKANQEFSEVINNFIDSLNIIDKKKYRVKTSIGMGTISKLWWCTIMDREFYKESYGIKDDRSLSADKGYYIAYLFSEDRKRVVLSISQPSKGITKQKNKNKLYYYQKKNEQIYFENNLNSGFIYLPKPVLSYNKLSNARDFETSIIIYKEYDLSENIKDSELLSDLKEFIDIYSKLLIYIKNKKLITIDTMKISLYTNKISDIDKDIDYLDVIEDEVIQNEAYKSMKYTSTSEIENANNNFVQYNEVNGALRYLRDRRLHTTVIENSGFKCNYRNDHETFSTMFGKRFMEGHHLIPLQFQSQFGSFRLDRYENIVSLCPICHSAIHYGDDEVKRAILEDLFNKSKMKVILKKFEVNSFVEFYDRFYL